MLKVNIITAKANLSLLLKQIEENNDEIIIKRAGTPVARVIKYVQKNNVNRLGIFKNQIKLTCDDDAWPDDIASKLCVKD